MRPIASSRIWWRSLLFGVACFALVNGMVHFSDWCYLAASAAVAAVVSAGLRPLHRWLMNWPRRPMKMPMLPWAMGCTLVVFGLGVLLTWPLRSWPGPDGLWPWGVGALLATLFEAISFGQQWQFPKPEQCANGWAKPTNRA